MAIKKISSTVLIRAKRTFKVIDKKTFFALLGSYFLIRRRVLIGCDGRFTKSSRQRPLFRFPSGLRPAKFLSSYRTTVLEGIIVGPVRPD
jgi:hypothetical protein